MLDDMGNHRFTLVCTRNFRNQRDHGYGDYRQLPLRRDRIRNRRRDSRKLTRCTCSFCARRGALCAYYAPRQFKLTTAADNVATYRWNTKLVAHNFCPTCGCATFTDSPAFELDGKWDGKTRRLGVNARLFDGFDAAEAPVTVIDGKNLW
jgi:hypothetical protein